MSQNVKGSDIQIGICFVSVWVCNSIWLLEQGYILSYQEYVTILTKWKNNPREESKNRKVYRCESQVTEEDSHRNFQAI